MMRELHLCFLFYASAGAAGEDIGGHNRVIEDVDMTWVGRRPAAPWRGAETGQDGGGRPEGGGGDAPPTRQGTGWGWLCCRVAS